VRMRSYLYRARASGECAPSRARAAERNTWSSFRLLPKERSPMRVRWAPGSKEFTSPEPLIYMHGRSDSMADAGMQDMPGPSNISRVERLSASGFQNLLHSGGGGRALQMLRQAEALHRREADTVAVFRRYDRDGSGDIDVSELRDALSELGVPDVDQASTQALLDKYDTDKSGSLELSEFVLLIREMELIAEEKILFNSDLARLKARLLDQARGLLNPRGQFVQHWDLTTAFCLLYTMFVTPYEVGLDLPTQADGLLLVNLLVTCIFLVDVIVQARRWDPAHTFTRRATRCKTRCKTALPTTSGGMRSSRCDTSSHGSSSTSSPSSPSTS
jgi:hypothetical protein